MTTSIAKLCALGKQPFALGVAQSLAMSKKSLNQLLAENLKREMKAKELSEKRLGEKSGLSPRTIANYLNTEVLHTGKGKERSAKLAEIDKIADALGVSAILLLSDQGEAAARARQAVAQAVKDVMQGPRLVASTPPSEPGSSATDDEVRAARAQTRNKNERNQD